MKNIISLFLLTLPAFAAYKNVRPIVIPHAHVSADLAGFPMVVAGTYPYLATTSNGVVSKVQMATTSFSRATRDARRY